MSEKTQVCVILGGRNSENYRSCASARDVIAALEVKNYEVAAYGMTMEANWIKFNDLAAVKKALTTDGFELNDETAAGINDSSSSILPPESLLESTVVFSTLMGAWGSDGTVQGFLETEIVRFVGSDTLGAAVATDKPTAKLLMKSVDIPTPAQAIITDKNWRRDPLSCVARANALKMPVVVKPARGSNGVGVSLAKFPRDWKKTIEIARNFDGRIIVEKYHEAERLIECNIIEDSKRKPILSEIIETKLHNDEKIFNFILREDKTKYSVEKAQGLEAEVIKLIHEYALKTFEVLKLGGFAQIEFILDKEGELLVLEVNSQPYLGKDGSFALSWSEKNMKYEDVMDQIVQEALSRPVGLI
jgi:D-alanine-D-alanine ligase